MHNHSSEPLSPAPGPQVRRQLADLCFAVIRPLRHHASELAAEFDLSFLQSRALWRLEQPLATGALAEQLGLDPSNITGVVDRLEARGLIERQPHPEDRRIKLLALTRAGRAIRADLNERLFTTVTLFEALTDAEQEQLAALLTKIVEHAEATDELAPVAP
ncbi:MAG TPA: MarR family transcriptional regulator [Acidimicrobiia bacterium]|nr:MarR family transcriptional regulator [Acidimicrobiia bacterium]